MDKRVIWQPLPGSQHRFMTCPFYEVLLEGNRGGGKTDALLMDFAQMVGRGYGEDWRGVIFRLTYPQLPGRNQQKPQVVSAHLSWCEIQRFEKRLDVCNRRATVLSLRRLG